MREIWKYEIKGANFAILSVPDGAQFLSFGWHGCPVLWMMVDPRAPRTERAFKLLLTGEEFDSRMGIYLGTTQTTDTNGEPFVLHLFEVIRGWAASKAA